MGEVRERLVKSSGLASRASLISTSKAKSERQESAILLQEAVVKTQDISKDNITHAALIHIPAAKMLCNLQFK